MVDSKIDSLSKSTLYITNIQQILQLMFMWHYSWLSGNDLNGG